MNSEWSLDELYSGLDDPKFAADQAALDAVLKRKEELAAALPAGDPLTNLKAILALREEEMQLSSDLGLYLGLRLAVNTQDNACKGAMGKLNGKFASGAGFDAKINKYIAGVENLEELIDSDEKLKEVRFLFLSIKDNAKHMLSDEAEMILARMDITGGSAWGDLQSYLTSTVVVDYNGEKLNLPGVRNLAYDPSAKVRKDAYEAELACYEKIKDSVAFALNNLKLQVINTSEMRGFASPLDQTLYYSRLKKETLEALIDVIRENLPQWHSYMKAKAELLGYAGSLPWYEIFAPVGDASGLSYTTDQAAEMLINLFSEFDADMGEMMRRAFSESWIDFFPHEGKEGGAFCAGMAGHGQSRILTNFDGSLSSVDTLAHELGHAFHNRCLEKQSILNDYTMPVAETASTFNENVFLSKVVKSETDPKIRLALLENQLMETNQIICDILSRYLFETEVFSRRSEEFMSADDLCDIMLRAQKEAYGDGLDENFRHPYMWVCKSHYYSSYNSFYNFPYAFGGLFARGLYAMYVEEGAAFVPKYRRMLEATSVMSCEDAAAVAGIDLTDRAFWEKSIRSYRKEIEEYIRLAKELKA